MRRAGWVVLALMAGPALALDGAAVVEGCTIDVEARSLGCLIRSNADETIAQIDLEAEIREPGRSLMWGRGEASLQVWGGLEPGETREVAIPMEGLPPEAAGRDLEWTFIGIHARNERGGILRSPEEKQAAAERAAAAAAIATEWQVRRQAGDELRAAQRAAREAESVAAGEIAAAPPQAVDDHGELVDPGPPMTSGEMDAFRLAVQSCWSVGNISTDAQLTVVTVSFALGRDGWLVGNPVLVESQGGTSEAAVTSAFEAARRAIDHCQNNGYPLPPEKYEQWREVLFTFDPIRGEVR